MKHEFTHHLETSKWYNSFVTYVYGSQKYQNWIAEKGGEAAYRQQIETEYAKAGLECDVEHEIIANFVGENLLGGMAGNIINEKGELVCRDAEVAAFIEKFAREKPTWFDSIIDHIQYLIAKIRMHFGKTSGRNVEAELKQMHRFLVQMKNTAKKEGGERQSLAAGEKAKTANLARLYEAKQRIENGEDSEIVRQETGWYKGTDGKWRFEINDKFFVIDETALKRLKETGSISLYELIKHDELFEAYPQLKDINVFFDSESSIHHGYYNKEKNIIVFSDSENKTELRKTIIHEVQHAVQEIEGFASGSSPEYWAFKSFDLSERVRSVKKELNSLLKDIGYSEYAETSKAEVKNGQKTRSQHRSDLENFKRNSKYGEQIAAVEAEYNSLKEQRDEIKKPKQWRDYYERTAGEIEARDAANRMDYTDEQRKNTRPDIDRTDVVFADDWDNFKNAQYNLDVEADNKKITVNMSDSERAEILRNTNISVVEGVFDNVDDIDILELENSIKSKAEKIIVPKLKSLGYLKGYTSNAISIAFDFTTKGLGKSLHSQMAYGGNYGDFLKVIVNLDELLHNSVLIENHTDKGRGTLKEDRTLKQVYVLLSALKDETKIIPVQFEIKEYINNDNRLYLAVAMTKIEETGVVGNTVVNQSQPVTSLIPVSNISIVEIFRNINTRDKNFLKYIPDEFLSNEQINSKRIAISEEQAKYDSNNQQGQYSVDTDTMSNAEIQSEMNDIITRMQSGEITTDEASRLSNELLNKAANKHGAIPKGENPKVDVTVPSNMGGNLKTRQHVRTILESGILPDNIIYIITKKLFTNGKTCVIITSVRNSVFEV